MNRQSLLLLALSLWGTAWLHGAEPLSFQELSLLVRTGETPQNIVNEAARRKLLQGLTPDQEAKLQQNGAPTALITALRSPALLATPQELQTYVARRQTQAQVAVAQTQAEAQPRPAPPQAVVLPDHFTSWIEAAKSAPARAMAASDAFSLAQLPEAKAKARAERKPLGFIVTSQKCFGQAYNTRQTSAYAALLHFHEAFKDPLVLVFVPQETDATTLPPAVAQGFKSAEAGNLAPNMAVVDVTASELIVEIPAGGPRADGPQRDEIFKTGAATIQQWLTFHPTALAPTVSPPPAP